MPLPRREDPIQALLNFARKRRVEWSEELTVGRWTGEPAARELVGRIKELDALETEMTKLTAPGSHFGEKDL